MITVMELISQISGDGVRGDAEVVIMLDKEGYKPVDCRKIQSVGMNQDGTIVLWADKSELVEPYQGAWQGR